MKTAFIGPGTMGFGMAMNLARGGQDLTVIARRTEALVPFAEKGISVSTQTEAAADCELVFLCLPDGRIVRETLLGEKAPAWNKGTLIVDCSTIDWEEAKALASELKARGVRYLDAPVSGHRERALAGTLTIMCGGAEEDFEEAGPYLERMGETVLFMGPSGSGQLAKMINNCALNICTASFCELMPLGVKMGLDPEKLGTVLMNASGSSYASKTLIPEILEGNFKHGFTMEGAYKDMLSMARLLEKEQISLPTFSGTKETYEAALQGGFGRLYKGAMIRVYEELLDVRCRREGFRDESPKEEK